MPLTMEGRDIVQCVEAVIEIGHNANLRGKPTKEGFTHDWTVYVRGQEGCDISHFVEKVVFHLHHTFSNPRRVVKVPPYHVSEMGYAGFDLPIEIFFKSKKKPRKIMFNYNLFLQVYEPVSYVRCEKLTFQKPSDEFKEKLINAGRVLVLPPGETQFADLCGPPTKTESPNKQMQSLTSKENVSKQMLNFSGNEKSSNSGKDISAALKSSVKQEKIDNSSNDHDAASSRRSDSSSIMVSTPSPLASQKRASDSSTPNENKPKKTKKSSSVSSERVRREDKQRSEEKENKDKVVKHKGCENEDESQSKYKDGKDYHKKDTSKQKSSKNSKEEKKESNLKDDKVSKFDDKKEAKDDKKEVRDDKKKLMDDKKEFKKDVKDDKKDGKDDNKVQNDTKEVKDGKRKVQNDKNKVINKNEVKNDKREVKHDQIEIKNDRKDVKDDRKGHKEVKENKKEVKKVNDDKHIKEVKDGKKEVIAKQSSSSSESRKLDDKCKGEIKPNTDKEEKSSECEHLSSKSFSLGKNDKEKSSNRNKQSETTTDAKSEHRKRPSSPLSALDGSLAKKQQDSVKHLSQVTSVELKEVLSLSSKTYSQIYSKSALKILMDELEDISSDDEDDITATVDISCQQKSVAKMSPSVESSKASPALSCKSNPQKPYKAVSENSSTIRKPIPSKERQEKSATKSVSEIKSESSDISDTRKKTQNVIQPPTKSPSPVTKFKNDENNCSVEKSTSTIDSIFDVKSQSKTAVKNLVVKTKSSTSSEHRKRPSSSLSALDGSLAKNQQDSVKHLSQVTSVELKEVFSLSSKTSNQIYSKSALKILMDELEYILSDDAHDITAIVDIFSRRKSLAKISPKESQEKSATYEEELIKLEELKKTLMGITDLSVLQKVVKLVLSSGYFEINDEFDSDLSALNLNVIRELQNFVATKI